MNLDLVVLAVRNILNRRRRSWLTIIGIFIGIAAVVSLVSLGQGLNQAVIGEFERVGVDKVYITPGSGGPTGTTSFAQTTVTLDQDDLRTIRQTRGVAEAAALMFRASQVTFGDTTEALIVAGIPTDESQELVQEGFNVNIEAGRTLRSVDRGSTVIGSDVAANTFGKRVGVRSKLEFEGEEFRVVGVMEPTGDPGTDQSLLVPLDTLADIYGEETYEYIFARVQDGFETAEVAENIQRELRQERGLDEGEEDFSVSTTQDLLSSFQNILGIVQAIVVGIASISLLVGGVGIMNTMYTAVTERTREIGVMKAVGAEDRQVLVLFMLESGMIGLLGGAMGALLGIGISQGFVAVARQYSAIPLEASIDPFLISGALLFAFLVGTISGTLPARNAAKLDPVDALRYE